MIGNQRPSIEVVPRYSSSAGDDAVELARVAGLELDDWQQHILRGALGERDGMWSAPTVGLCLARQNGKGSVLEALELAHLYLFESQFIVHSAHRMDTSKDHFRRLVELIDGSVELRTRLKKRPRMTNGQEEIELATGQRITFRTRAKGGSGRGLRADLLVIDEAFDFPEASAASLLPTTSARPNGQTWFTSSAVDQRTMPNGLILSRIRKNALSGDDTIAWFEWGIDQDDYDEELIYSDEYLAQTNPAFGIRISATTIKGEQGRLSKRDYAVERLSVGDWVDPDARTTRAIPRKTWDRLADPISQLVDPVTFAFDIRPGHFRSASIAVAGRRPDGKWHVDVVYQNAGTSWLPTELARLLKRRENTGIYCDTGSLVESVLPGLDAVHIKPVMTTGKEMAAACAMFLDAVNDEQLRHPGTEALDVAVDAATQRDIGGSRAWGWENAWAWNRRDEASDVSPLVAATLAMWGASQRTAEPMIWDISSMVGEMVAEQAEEAKTFGSTA
jgi:hypothetical protein